MTRMMVLVAMVGCAFESGREPAREMPDAAVAADAGPALMPDAVSQDAAHAGESPFTTCQHMRRTTITLAVGDSDKKYFCPPPAIIETLTLPVHVRRDPLGPVMFERDSGEVGVYGFPETGPSDWPELHPDEQCVWVPIDLATCETGTTL